MFPTLAYKNITGAGLDIEDVLYTPPSTHKLYIDRVVHVCTRMSVSSPYTSYLYFLRGTTRLLIASFPFDIRGYENVAPIGMTFDLPYPIYYHLETPVADDIYMFAIVGELLPR